jgi:hypothetical protein
MTACLCPNESLRAGIRRVLDNHWFVAVVIFITAMVIRWGFHLYNHYMSGLAIYHGSLLSDGLSNTYKAISIGQQLRPKRPQR